MAEERSLQPRGVWRWMKASSASMDHEPDIMLITRLGFRLSGGSDGFPGVVIATAVQVGTDIHPASRQRFMASRTLLSALERISTCLAYESAAHGEPRSLAIVTGDSRDRGGIQGSLARQDGGRLQATTGGEIMDRGVGWIT